MSWIQDELTRRNLPPIPDDPAAIRELLQSQEYGRIPPQPIKTEFEIVGEPNESYCGGTAVFTTVRITSTLPDGKVFSFPVSAVVPKQGDSLPGFVFINFRPEVPDRLLPSEEISDNGFAMFSFWCSDVSTDDNTGDFTNGLGPVLFPDGYRGPDGASKLCMWAWAAMRVMDYVETLPRIDKKNVAVVGHSRLGKTALIAGAYDRRFNFVISNDSGCGGAALFRGKIGETIGFMREVWWFWYCERFLEFGADPSVLPFDQHFLMSLIAPRYLYVASASEDEWADPTGEYLGAWAASEAWTKRGLPGIVGADRAPVAGDEFQEGSIGYHNRPGCHYLSRYDWQRYMKFMRSHKVQ